MKKYLILLFLLTLSLRAYADTTIKLPVELLYETAKKVELKASKNFVQKLLINQVMRNSSINGVKLSDYKVEDLMEYFNSDDLFEKIGTNKLVEPNTGATLEFNSDDTCKKDNCTITVDLNGDKGPNEVWTNSEDPKDRIIFTLKRNKNDGLEITLPDFH